MILTLVLSLTSGCSNRIRNSLSCTDRVRTQIDNITRKGVMATHNENSITIIFLNSFNGRFKAYVNGALKFDEMVVTNETSGQSNKYFVYRYEKGQERPILKIEGEDGACFDIRVTKGYRLIYVFRDESNPHWTLRFSDRFYVDN